MTVKKKKIKSLRYRLMEKWILKNVLKKNFNWFKREFKKKKKMEFNKALWGVILMKIIENKKKKKLP